jgi:hypothetical protein
MRASREVRHNEEMSTPRGAESWRGQAFSGNARFELKQLLGQGGMGVVYERTTTSAT